MPNSDAAAWQAATNAVFDDALIGLDNDELIVRWNRGAEMLYDYPTTVALGRNYSMLVPPDHREEERQWLAAVRAGQHSHTRVSVRLRRDGTRIPVALSAAVVLTVDGNALGMVLLEQDERGRSSAERASRRLAAIIDSTDDAIISKDLNGIVTSWNPAATRIFGFTAEEMVGESIRRIIPAERQQEEDTVLGRIRRGERIDHFETIRRRKDGTLLPISLTVSPIHDPAGRVVGASKIARDISESVGLRENVARQAQITSRLNEIGSAVAATLDRETIVQKVTDASTELTGAEFGAFFYNVTDPDNGDAFMLYALSGASKEAFSSFPKPRATAILAPTFRGESVVRLDDVTTDERFGKNAPYHGLPSGHLSVRSYLAIPVKSVAGDVLGGLFFGHSRVGVFTKEHEDLAVGIAAWASVALQNAHLYVEAQEANRAKDEFLAVLSHELRTPLNSIMGYTRLLRGGILTGDKAKRGLETLERNATLLTQIVEDVLDVSRIVAGKIRLDVQAVELPVVVHNAIATVSPTADAKGVRIQTTIDPRVGPVAGDPDRLQQVVWNLLTNAVKFTPRHGRVQVRLERVNSHIEIVVSDTGIGIRPEFLPYVFERFRQADSTITRKVGGLGLGLAIVRHIIEMHGGTVQAASSGAGQGATFRVLLPLMIVHPHAFDGEREHPRRETMQALTELADLRGVRILAIDDEPDALALLAVVLESAGAEVSVLSSAIGAVAEIERLRPDALVVDLGMPELDGFEFIKQVRSSPHPFVRAVPAAALTAFARSDDRTRALRSGFEMHLAKPVDPGELVASVLTLVRRKRQEGQPG